MIVKKDRLYQTTCNEVTETYFCDDCKSGVVVLPVNSGKTYVMCRMIERIMSKSPRCRIIIVTHVKELIEQMYEEIKKIIPDADVGIYCAGLGRKEMSNDITICSIQSVWNKTNNFNRAPQVIICDECHLIPHNEDTTYRKFFTSCWELNPKCKVIGYSGTPFRSDSGFLDEGKGRLFEGRIYELPMSFMLKEGYWSPLITPKTETLLDATGVPTINGEYNSAKLEKAVDVDEKTIKCVDEIIKYAGNRNKWLVFCAGVKHCTHVRDEIRSRGISCEMVLGDTPKQERADILQKYRDGLIKCICNVATLTTGINIPDIDMIALMRPLKSNNLYIQCLGRGVRTVYAKGYDLETRQGRLDAIANGSKPNCMVLDFGNIINTLGPIDAVDIRKREKKETEEKGKAVIKICPACGTECAAAQRFCYECSYEFPVAAIETTATKGAAVLSADIAPEEHKVIDVSYKIHRKKNDEFALPTLRVDYTCMGGRFSEFICFEHRGIARNKAVQWFRERLPLFPIPDTVESAVALPYPMPEKISTKREGKYSRVIGVEFPELLEPIQPPKTYEQELEDADEIPF